MGVAGAANQGNQSREVDERMLKSRAWVPARCETFIQGEAARVADKTSDDLERELKALVEENHAIHDQNCINLNPATNIMNPRTEALLAQGLSTRPSLGYPGDKYETGLEAIEKIEIMAAELAAEIFGADYAEIRVASGAMSNLYAFMATAKPGDKIIAPPAAIGGHVTHHGLGAAGLYGLATLDAPIDPQHYTVDVAALRDLALKEKPALISIGGSLNLFPHPVGEIRAIADEVGANVLFDAAHLSGMIAGGGWPQPLQEGAHVMTMSTYKSLGGPPSGLLVTSDASLAERLDKIAFPGLTANFDAAKSAALAMSLLDWREYGAAYAQMMAENAKALAKELHKRRIALFAADKGFTQSHQFAIEAAPYGGGQTASKRLRRANILACGIGLPIAEVEGDLNGIRIGTPEITRIGFEPSDMPELANLLAGVLKGEAEPETVAPQVTSLRQRFKDLKFVRS